MTNNYSVYCDESCHLEHDHQKSMVIGGVWCGDDFKTQAYARIRDLKRRHELPPGIEIKWTKISEGNKTFYLDLVDYFFDNSDLHFRCIVVPDKSVLNHKEFRQTHDDWYYKMYFDMIKTILRSDSQYKIYLDIKDSIGAPKIQKLHEVLANDSFDFDKHVVKRIQLVRSHEIELLQLADVLIGAVMAANRGTTSSKAKLEVIEKIRTRSSKSLVKTTLFSEQKFNILIWNPTANILEG